MVIVCNLSRSCCAYLSYQEAQSESFVPWNGALGSSTSLRQVHLQYNPRASQSSASLSSKPNCHWCQDSMQGRYHVFQGIQSKRTRPWTQSRKPCWRVQKHAQILIDRKVSSRVLIKSFLIVLMAIIFVIWKRIFIRNSSTLIWKFCFGKRRELSQRRNMMKLSSTWQRSMIRQFVGFSITQNRNIGPSYISKINDMVILHQTSRSLNSAILTTREFPILSMFEHIRRQLMSWFMTRHEMDLNIQGLIINKITTEIQKLLNEHGRRYRFHQNTSVLYEIQSNETLHEYRVNLAQCTCSWKAWQSTGYPCGHAVAIILHCRENPQIYTATFYTLAIFHDIYKNPIIQQRRQSPCWSPSIPARSILKMKLIQIVALMNQTSLRMIFFPLLFVVNQGDREKSVKTNWKNREE